jgi:lipopolysaccharide biosynthesis glycosyltransferase
MERMAIFATANDQYVPKAVMALRSFQRWHPGYGYFLLGTKSAMSRESLDFIHKFSIKLLEVDERQRFAGQVQYKVSYPAEVFYKLRGAELIAEHGFEYSMAIDGDVFCARPLEIESVLDRIEGYAARPVGTLGRTFGWKQKHQNTIDFSFEHIRNLLGINEQSLTTRYEINGGVVIWNNRAMMKIGLFEKAMDIFQLCRGSFVSEQDLLAITSAKHEIPFLELGDPYNFNFFEDSYRNDAVLIRRIRKGQFEDIQIVHFVWCKPWLRPARPNAAKAYFINAWRKYVIEELGVDANELFDDLSPVRAFTFTDRVFSRARRIGSKIIPGLSK